MKALIHFWLFLALSLLPAQGQGILSLAGSPPAAAGSALLTNLKAYWKLDEASGTRADSVGSNPLTDTNTVTASTGKINDAGQFTMANSEYLAAADSSSLSTGDVDFFVSGWFYPDTVDSGGKTLMGKGSEWNLTTDSSGDIYVFVASNYILTFDANMAANTWHWIAIWFDSAANTISINLNNGTAITSSSITPPTDGAGEFRLGCFGSAVGDFWNGRIDEVYYRVGSIPDSTDRATLYGAGTPPAYPF